MNELGEAYPSQEVLAADTALGVRTVREAVLEARRHGWVGVMEHLRPGQAWRRHHYVACIPDSLDITSVELGGNVDLAAVIESTAAQWGDVLDPLHGRLSTRPSDRARQRSPKGAAITAARRGRDAVEGAAITAAPLRESGEGAAVDRQDVRQLTQEGAAVDRQDVRPSSPIKVPSEGSIGRDQREGFALPRDPFARGGEDRKAGEQEARKRVEKLHSMQPHLQASDLAKITRTSIELAKSVIEARP